MLLRTIRGSLFLRITTMIGCVIVLTGMIISLLLYEYRGSVYKNCADSVSGAQSAFDLTLADVNLNSYSMLDSADFSTIKIITKFGSFLSISRTLANYIACTDLITNVFYLNQDTQTVYTLGKPYKYDDFSLFNEGYGITSEEYKSFFLKDESNFWIPAQSFGLAQPEVLTYVVTYTLNAETPEYALVIHMDEQKLRHLFAKYLPSNDAVLLLVDVDRQLLFATNASYMEASLQERIAFLSLDLADAQTLRWNRKLYEVFIQPSRESKMSYVLLLPAKGLFSSMRTGWYAFAPMVIATVLAAGLAVFAVTRLTKKNKSLLNHKIAQHLIQYGYQEDKELQDDLRHAATPELALHFQAIVIMVAPKHETVKRPMVLQEILRFIETSLVLPNHVQFLLCTIDDTVYLLINGDADAFAESVRNFCDIKKRIEDTFEVYLSIGVGETVTREEITRSVEQARVANNYRFVKGEDAVIFFHDINHQIGGFAYPSDTMALYYNAILSCHEDAIQTSLDHLLDSIQKNNSLFFATCLAYDIVNTSLKAMRELSYSSSVFRHVDINNRNGFRSMDEVRHVLRVLIGDIIVAFNQGARDSADASPGSKRLSLIERVQLYINENYTEPDFSVKAMAMEFSMSTSNFSHFFKKQAHENVSDYIFNLRMQKAKMLLTTTERPLQEIARQCGYTNISTFLRQFKQSENMTPSRYRTSYRM